MEIHLKENSSFIRTLPSTPEFHRIMQILRVGYTTDRELGSVLPSPCPEEVI